MKRKLLYLFPLFFCNLSCTSTPKETPPTLDPVTQYFPNEAKPALTAACFQGAYYRKVVTSRDRWVGISGKLKLPDFVFDENRRNPAKPQQYLDNPSVYIGGQSNGQETDIGLTWEVIKDENGVVSPDRKAFRPFLRRTKYGDQPADYKNAPAESQYYWYPGEEVVLTLLMIDNKILRFTVEGAGKKYETDYSCDGYQFGANIEFKRVNAIDQVSNEGKPAQPTKTKVNNSYWLYTKLYRKIEGELISVNLHQGRFTDMRCPDVKYFTVTSSEDEKKIGAESITIDGEK